MPANKVNLFVGIIKTKYCKSFENHGKEHTEFMSPKKTGYFTSEPLWL